MTESTGLWHLDVLVDYVLGWLHWWPSIQENALDADAFVVKTKISPVCSTKENLVQLLFIQVGKLFGRRSSTMKTVRLLAYVIQEPDRAVEERQSERSKNSEDDEQANESLWSGARAGEGVCLHISPREKKETTSITTPISDRRRVEEETEVGRG